MRRHPHTVKPEESLTDRIHTHSSKRIICKSEEKMFHFILFAGLLGFSMGASSTYGVPTTTELTAETTSESWTAPSTQQPDPSVITGLRVAVISVVDLSSKPNSPEMELLVRQIESFIPSEHRATTSITVRKVQRGSSMS